MALSLEFFNTALYLLITFVFWVKLTAEVSQRFPYNTPLGAKLGLWRSIIYSKSSKLFQIIPNYPNSKLCKLFQIIQIVQIRGIKRKVGAGGIGISNLAHKLWSGGEIKNLARIRLAKFLIFFSKSSTSRSQFEPNFKFRSHQLLLSTKICDQYSHLDRFMCSFGTNWAISRHLRSFAVTSKFFTNIMSGAGRFLPEAQNRYILQSILWRGWGQRWDVAGGQRSYSTPGGITGFS